MALQSEEASTSTDFSSGSMPALGITRDISPSFEPSTRGLDFISSSGYPKIEFGYSDDEEEEDGGTDEGSDSDDDRKLAADFASSSRMILRP